MKLICYWIFDVGSSLLYCMHYEQWFYPVEIIFHICDLSPILLKLHSYLWAVLHPILKFHIINVACPPFCYHISYLWLVLHPVEVTYHTCELSPILLKLYPIFVNCPPFCWSHICDLSSTLFKLHIISLISPLSCWSHISYMWPDHILL